MVTFFAEYGLFLAKALTVVVAALVVFGTLFASSARGRKEPGGQIKVRQLNDDLEMVQQTIKEAVLSKEHIKEELKQEKKEKKKQRKADKKALKKSAKSDDSTVNDKKRVYVLDFDGDTRASAVESLRKEITAVLSMARPEDEVVLRLESPGGMVHSYGLASSQLERIKNKGVPLTICVDKVAASGGYMMACIADQIVAAPFAILGSIGVIAQLPNIHRLLKKNDIDFEMFTAGEYKRTVTMMGENTEKGREKFKEELEDTHILFKEFVGSQRSKVDIDKVATGEHWYGIRAKELDLVDMLQTSDEYLVDACGEADVFEVTYKVKRSMADRIGLAAEDVSERLMLKAYRAFDSRFL
ncbi:MAG: protease SohB [Gammaproteobacteria bacterium]|nr:MAG: protease SohB [Gammaproteobacteria bacterium]